MAVGLKQSATSFAILLGGSLGGSLLFGLPGGAQETDSKGNLLTFGIGQRLQYSDNRDLDPTSLGDTTEAITNLSFGLIKDTGSSSLKVDARVELRLADAPSGSTTSDGVNNPFLGIKYQALSVGSIFDFNVSLRQTNLDQSQSVTDFDTGSGERGNYLIGTAISWGRDAPFSYGLTASYEAIDYSNTSDADLRDAERFKFGVNAGLALSPTTRLTLGLNRSDFQEDGAGSGELQINGNAGLVIQRGNGDVVSTNIFVDNTETGERQGLSAQYQIALPNGSLRFTPGLVRATTGKVYWTSDFQWQQALPTGSFSAEWSQQVTSQSENDEEVLLSNVSLSYAHQINPLNRLRFNFDWAQQVYTATEDTSRNASVGAAWSRSVTKDWNLDVGYTHRLNDETAEDSAQSNTVYLQLNRSFTTKY